MATPLGYLQHRTRVTAVIDGQEMPVTACTITYALNTIPQAVCRFALGKDADGKRSPAEALIGKLNERKPAQIYITIEPQGRFLPPGVRVGASLPAGKTLVFDGDTAWGNHVRNANAEQYEVTFEHWLSRLNHTSAVSPSVTPAVSRDLAFPMVSTVVTPDTQAGKSTGGGWTTSGIAERLLSIDVRSDLWKKGILPWYKVLAGSDHLADANLGSPLSYTLNQNFGTNKSNGNAQALDAINRLLGSLNAPKLDLQNIGAGAAGVRVASKITETLANTTLDQLVDSSLWDHLISLAGQYLFVISPGVDDTYAAPWLPTLRRTFTNVFHSEYDDLRVGAGSLRAVRGVVLVTGDSWSSGANLSDAADQVSTYQNLGFGVYKAGNTGAIIVRQAPAWLDGVPQTVVGAPGTRAEDLTVPTPSSPAVPAPKPDQVKSNDVLATMNAYLQRYAQGFYGLEVLTHRTGSLTGRLRYDIRPGSLLNIETSATSVDPAARRLGPKVIAAVTQVNITIDAEKEQESTTFSLSHLRSEAENQTGVTLTQHPLYNSSWYGGALVE